MWIQIAFKKKKVKYYVPSSILCILCSVKYSFIDYLLVKIIG